MMPLGKTIRFVEEKNLKWLPKSGRKLGGRRKPHQEGLICVQLNVEWVKKNTCMFKRLMGRR
jgi:hypothetical protein